MDAETWLNNKYSKDRRHEVKEKKICCLQFNLTHSLKLKGFINLITLEIENQKIIHLSLNECTKLKELYCSGNDQLQTLEINNLTKLILLKCANNKLKDLDISQLEKLKECECEDNQLTCLKLGYHPNLRNLICSDNEITEINLNSLINEEPKIEYLDLSNNNFSRQNISIFEDLISLEVLMINDNSFYGSLAVLLEKLAELYIINISNTNVNCLDYKKEKSSDLLLYL
ncbi:hypothetical protein [endosymbiont GvMRE of Glomus versiforme]|uniref:hypothetical protein n=1 Tax=endosymbiont GvMRE of Glomus versiforme TaxID=2039283 RepID=UPI000EBD65A6|nr:hypothetical protein [endosymbiont GvMRE of Glomus versiforme]RHZ35325.1 hypothetical protein GvMRE_IIg188 [endosymbiont GvMRE of Glomus versiforme]